MIENDFDVLIVGGGPVGLALALALTGAMRDLRIGIIDRRLVGVPTDRRASAIAAGVRRVLDGLGIWDRLAAVAQPVTAMRITDSGSGDIARPLFLSFAGDVAPGEAFAHLVPNTELASALIDAVAGLVEFIAPAEIIGMQVDADRARLTLRDGRELTAPLLVAADGQNSAIRGLAGIDTIEHDYRQAGIVTTITHELPHQGVAYEHFRPAGPFASLPLPGNRSSLVWTESLDEAARLSKLPAEQLALEIEAAMGSCFGTVTAEEPVQVYPLKLKLARSLVGDRLAIIGDAAHVVHPIAGQGLNLGLKDVAALAEAVIDALRLGLDHGSPDVLGRYERWRRFDIAMMAAATDNLNRLFSNDVGLVRGVRDLGLGVVDRIPALKDFFIAQAAGLGGERGPKLLSGLPI